MKTFINNQRLAQLAGVTFRSEVVKSGPIVYSRTHLVVEQFPMLEQFGSCVLVTSFSDACCTDEMAKKLPSNVRRWFSNNVTAHNRRVTAVPLGIRTSPDGEVLLRAAIDSGRLQQRNLVYMNFMRHIPRRVNPRAGLYDMFQPKPWVTTEGGLDHVPMQRFCEQMLSHPFILSPPGAGPDCHRHWEAILLGAIPIVLRSEATRLLDDLPCLQVNGWDEVTEERLRHELPQLTPRFSSPAMEKCWFEPWKKMILES